MNTLSRTIDVVFWLALVGWISSVVAAGVAAAGVFAILPSLDLSVGRYEGFDPDQHGVLAGGHVMEPIFTAVDVTQVLFALIVLAAAIIQVMRRGPSRVMRFVRLGVLILAIALLGYRVGVQAPRMNSDLRAYWEAAEANDVETATRHRAAFDAEHPIASRLYEGTLASLLVLVGLSAVALGPPGRGRPSDNQLEPPALLGRS